MCRTHSLGRDEDRRGGDGELGVAGDEFHLDLRLRALLGLVDVHCDVGRGGSVWGYWRVRCLVKAR